MKQFRFTYVCCLLSLVLLAGCTEKNHFMPNNKSLSKPPMADDCSKGSPKVTFTNNMNDGKIMVVEDPQFIPVLVNKQIQLPETYSPSDLVDPDIPFIFKEKLEKRKMRSEAAEAIERLFADAKQQGVELLGVSAYRSHKDQQSLFNYYVNKDGYEAAKAYSALPGTSEHETGLAIDVTGGNGECAAENCFAGTKEAKWLEKHAPEYGFIIRYPKGKESITGYQYEPWHLRYVGKTIAAEISKRGITLEEYYNTVQVNN